MDVRLLARELAEAVLPQRCVACERFGAALHQGCLDTLPRATGPRCERCWAPVPRGRCERCAAAPPAFAGLRTPFTFDGAVRRALLEAKFRGVTAVLEPLAGAAAEAVPTAWSVECVLPVPLHRSRERRRGYNQAAILARHVAGRLAVPCEERGLVRVRATPPQASLDAEKRSRNVREAFAWRGGPPPYARVLVIDDVTTTGATLEAVASTLRGAGVLEAFALAIARELARIPPAPL